MTIIKLEGPCSVWWVRDLLKEITFFRLCRLWATQTCGALSTHMKPLDALRLREDLRELIQHLNSSCNSRARYFQKTMSWKWMFYSARTSGHSITGDYTFVAQVSEYRNVLLVSLSRGSRWAVNTGCKIAHDKPRSCRLHISRDLTRQKYLRNWATTGGGTSSWHRLSPRRSGLSP